MGFSLGYELAYTNMLTMIDLAGSPLLAADRGEDDPIFVAGGSCTLNPAVVGPFLDLILLGDGEEAVLDMRRHRRATWKADGGARARHPGPAARTAGRLVAGRRPSPVRGPGSEGSERLSAAAARSCRSWNRCTTGWPWRSCGAVCAAAVSARRA